MQLIEWPFGAAEALDEGTLTFRELRRFYRAVHPGVCGYPSASML
ncbi:MAG: hypothetical protein ABW001_12610 [Mycobacterium sp.]